MEKKIVSAIMLALLSIGTFNSALGFQPHETSEPEKSRPVEDLRFTHTRTYYNKEPHEEQARIVEHRIAPIEIGKLKRQIGIWEEGRNCNQIIDGHGTGLRPPTNNEWMEIAGKAYLVDRILLDHTIQAPAIVDQTTQPSFPPIGHQDGEGSCTTWAVGYYMKTFQEAKEHGWDLAGAQWLGGYNGYPTTAYQDRIFSPDFIYHLINGGVDQGSSIFSAINLVCSIGASSWKEMPYDPVDSTSWPSEDAWREAPLYRGNSSSYEFLWLDTDDDLTSLKNWIASDHLAVITVDANKYSYLTSGDLWTLDNYVNPSTNHANTIVGYDDNIEYTEEGQSRQGAFKIANSWGEGGWESIPDGCYWISYEAMKQRVRYCAFYRDLIGYEPELAASFRLDHPKRDECSLTVGIGNESAPIQTKAFNVNGGDHPFCSNNILLDITEFKDLVPTVYYEAFFLKVYDGGSSDTGTIDKFAVEYAQSQDTPLYTVNYDYVRADVTLLPLETSWMSERLVNSDEDFIDDKISVATDSNGYLCIAYEDWYPVVNQQAIFVRRSTDGGNTWPIMVIGFDSTHNLGYPSIAIDPQNDAIFVAVEREWTSSDHDILVLRCVDGVWSWSSVANVLGSDDRFPSITSEYSYGEANRKYISYEYVHSHNDRDLMFAKSTDQGVTWSIKKLHGDWPDYNVHAQTSITNAEGYLYIAYKWGADYDSVCEVRIDRSTDFGSSWTQFADIDGLSNSCSFPSIAATHGGSRVTVAFQYDWSPNDIDVWYSFSIDRGTSWTKGKPLFVSPLEDEKQPTLVVDGGGMTGNNIGGYFHVVCKCGSYALYRKAHYIYLSSWNQPEFVSERWVGKGLAITTQLEDGSEQFHPCMAWTDERTKDIYYSNALSRIYIRADGRVQPSIANITSLDNVTYTFTGNINDEIVIERSNIIVDGNGYTLQGTGYPYNGKGIYLYGIGNVTIENANIKGFDYGVYLNATSDNVLSGNNIAENMHCGIHMEESSNNTVSGNNITGNWEGIKLSDSSYNFISGNRIFDHRMERGGCGIGLGWSSHCTILGNRITNNDYGILFSQSSSNTITENVLEANGNEWSGGHGELGIVPSIHLGWYSNNNDVCHNNFLGNVGSILIALSSHNRVSGNDMTGGSVGIGLLHSSYNNTVSGNNISNSWGGIWLEGASNNFVYHNNIVDNYNQVWDSSWLWAIYDSSSNIWDNGYPSGGNYWSDHTGGDLHWGPNQNQTGSDGIRDNPYVIDASNSDNYPLMSPYEYWSDPIPGDINKDMRVDREDLSQLATPFGSTPEKTNWNPNSDLNGDDLVDVFDLFNLSRNYGQIGSANNTSTAIAHVVFRSQLTPNDQHIVYFAHTLVAVGVIVMDSEEKGKKTCYVGVCLSRSHTRKIEGWFRFH